MVSIRIVADCEALFYQVTQKLKRAKSHENKTIPPIIFIHCCMMGFIPYQLIINILIHLFVPYKYRSMSKIIILSFVNILVYSFENTTISLGRTLSLGYFEEQNNAEFFVSVLTLSPINP